jgi:hypothetical protein
LSVLLKEGFEFASFNDEIAQLFDSSELSQGVHPVSDTEIERQLLGAP